MVYENNLFKLFGGIRPMARALGVPPSNVDSWKRVGRIPAEKQPHVLKVARSLGLAITEHDIIFPLGSDEPSKVRPDASIGKAAPPTDGAEAHP